MQYYYFFSKKKKKGKERKGKAGIVRHFEKGAQKKFSRKYMATRAMFLCFAQTVCRDLSASNSQNMCIVFVRRNNSNDLVKDSIFYGPMI
jgi:preprotein translocase subunit Sec61beta